jgi:hypothetical protein
MNERFGIHVTYTGNQPNLKPAASAFSRMIKKMVNPDGTFTDAALEAEFQDWKRRQTKSADAATPTDQLKGLVI